MVLNGYMKIAGNWAYLEVSCAYIVRSYYQNCSIQYLDFRHNYRLKHYPDVCIGVVTAFFFAGHCYGELEISLTACVIHQDAVPALGTVNHFIPNKSQV